MEGCGFAFGRGVCGVHINSKMPGRIIVQAELWCVGKEYGLPHSP
jgi:hypothetical protein